MLEWFIYGLVLALSLVAIGLNIASLPGNWVVFLAAAGLSAWHDWHHPAWWILPVMFVVLLIAEGLEFLGGMVGAKAFGASRTASWAALFGAVVGGVIGIPPLSAVMLLTDHLAGAVIGAFLAAWLVELMKKKPMKESLRAAIGAALGRGAGIVTKIGGGLIVWLFLAIAACPLI